MTAFGTQSADGAGPGDQARIQFQGETLIELGDKGGHESIKARSQPAIARLNAVWRLGEPAVLRVITTPAGRAALALGDETFLEVLPGDHLDRDAREVAGRWAAAVAERFERTGRSLSVQE